MAWHSAPDRLDEPRACLIDGRREGHPLVGGVHQAGLPANPKGMHLPNPRGKTGRARMQGRRGGRVVEGARLESVFTGDRNAGSNPALSAIIKPLKPLRFSIPAGAADFTSHARPGFMADCRLARQARRRNAAERSGGRRHLFNRQSFKGVAGPLSSLFVPHLSPSQPTR